MKIGTYLLLIFGLFSCQPELPPIGQGGSGPIAAHFSGLLDGQPLLYEAGIDHQYLHTQLELHPTSVFETTASIRPKNCDGCGQYFEITMRDFESNDGSRPMQPDSTFEIKSYPFQLGTAGTSFRRVQLRQRNLDGLNPIQNHWSILNLANNVVAQSNTNEAEFILPIGNYTTRLISTFANGCTDTSINPLSLDTSIGSGTACTAEMTINRIPSSTSMFLDTLNVQVPNPTQVIWRIEGMTFTGGGLFLMTDSFISRPVFEVELEVISASCTAKVVQRIAKNPSLNCATGFRVSSVNSVDPLQLGHVRITYIDALGVLYGSHFASQPNWAQFELLSVDSFPENRDGQATLLLRGRTNCLLFRADDQEVFKELNAADFKLAFPYKKQ